MKATEAETVQPIDPVDAKKEAEGTESSDRKVTVPKQGGWLRQGNPGNKGGTGRPTERIRMRAGLNLEKHLAQCDKLAKMAGAAAEKAYLAGNLNQASTAHRDHTKGVAAQAEIAIGKQVTTTLDNPRQLSLALEAIETIYGKDERYLLVVAMLEDIYKT